MTDQRLTVDNTAGGVQFSAFNAITQLVVLDVQGADVMCTFDGSAPTTTNGHRLYDGSHYTWSVATAAAVSRTKAFPACTPKTPFGLRKKLPSPLARFGPRRVLPSATHHPTGVPSVSNIPAFMAATTRRPCFETCRSRSAKCLMGFPSTHNRNRRERARAQIKPEAKPVSPPEMMLQNGKTRLIPAEAKSAGTHRKDPSQ